MFDDIGRKIKALASVLCWVGIIVSVIYGIVLMIQGKLFVATGITVLLLGSLFSWIGSFTLYGFGEMVENSDIRTELAVKADMEKSREGKPE